MVKNTIQLTITLPQAITNILKEKSIREYRSVSSIIRMILTEKYLPKPQNNQAKKEIVVKYDTYDMLHNP